MADASPTIPDRDGQKFVAGFARGLAVIEAFGPEHRSLSVAEVAALTGLDRAVARRLLLTLVELGFATVEKKQFALTSNILRLGYTYLASLGLDSRLQPHLDKLSGVVGEAVSVSVLSGNEVVFVARSEAPGGSIAYVLKAGLKLPAFSSSSGRVLLAAKSDDDIAALLQATKIEARTPKTITDRKQVLDLVRKARERGYATNDQELELELFGLSVPIRNRAGGTVASLNVNSQARRVTAKRITDTLLPAMRVCAQDISGVLL
ncbi:helix-turn-helix domain-containing protein [Bradyrhizobium sp. U87765 SZCCT0131]|uniref:IclR family transcriptional regulator domain-containing protein n=1 Tax=unclassified Bradyrhizobium TaxID=2631580 RepID=UPI001BA55622|nr:MULTISPECIES: IclR family transcriptional regulator C-terminal domain-containing protein [unclassified Bradyrhizobium]MBR1219017.1 helix-turn-helix domain-containing protein [Bradyrhizobium sp. U87765 SZCCT0131]MBR1261668.1 helix-turn-helix domain-containing protein [Bradyrhizobium sp. U87765 SZCCT0134]MBR1306479.1 helix-turn-helix domain-containing protein [Bradyrhizobium sp. U87765 SZCCT0110]MBR1317450.1 helix-turn-helix domain-containing protein [Bradyrhizobium sp. U87765 SZCCT0109]MBR13